MISNAAHILLASHGTEGAIAAENFALQLCEQGADITHLVVVPELWKDMMGDDWLNNGHTRDRFGRYLESELGKEIDNHCDSLEQQAQDRNIGYTCEIVMGKPDSCLVNASQAENFELVIIGSPRPKNRSGLRSRMATDYVIKNINVPLLIVPFPND